MFKIKQGTQIPSVCRSENRIFNNKTSSVIVSSNLLVGWRKRQRFCHVDICS